MKIKSRGIDLRTPPMKSKYSENVVSGSVSSQNLDSNQNIAK